MQIERFFYWFFDPAWWISATEGTVGALVGFIGLFLVFRLTRSHDLERDRGAREAERRRIAEEQEAERKRIAEERTLAGVAELYQKLLGFRVKGSNAITIEDIDDLSNSLMLFSLRERVDYPNTSEWADEQSSHFDRWFRQEKKYGKALVYGQSAALAGILVAWVQAQRPDGLLTRDEVEQQWEEAYVKLKEESEVSSKAFLPSD